MAIVVNKDGSANLTIKWDAYSQGANPASGLILYWKSMEAVAITGATQANPCVITAVGHGLSTGDVRRITDVLGMTEINDKDYTVTEIDSDHISLDGLDSTGYTAYTSGGIISSGPIVSTDNAVKLAVDTTSHTLEGVVADMVYRFGLAAYKTTLTGMAVGPIKDHSSWQKVQAATSVDYIGNISGEAAADIKNKVKGMNTSGNFVGKGTGNQRIVIDYVNGRIYFYDASDAEILKIGEDVIGTYDGVDLGNLGVIAGGGNSRTGNQSPIYLNAATNDSTTVLNQVIFVENFQGNASNSATIRGIKGVAQSMEVTFNSTNASSTGDKGLSTTSNTFTFNAGDSITVQAIQNLTIVGKIDDMAVMVEFES